VPGSKSISIRALWLSTATGTALRLHGVSAGEDVRCAVDCLRSLGREVLEAGDSLEVLPGSRDAGGPLTLGVGESGTCARFATAYAALCRPPGSETRIAGLGSLARRRSAALFDALRGAGAELTSSSGADASWPVEVRAAARPERLSLDSPRSSQELSALLVACCHGPGASLEVRGPVPSAPFVELTAEIARRFGARVDGSWTVSRGEAPTRVDLRVEPDASLAAVAWGAGVLSGTPVRVAGLDRSSVQGDARILDHLSALGCQVESSEGATVVSGSPIRPAALDLTGEPDLAPVLVPLVALAVRATGKTGRVTGLATLPGKESDRLEGLRLALEACGFEVATEDGSALAIRPGEAPATGDGGRWLDPRGDHRMAYAHVLCAWLGSGVLGTRDPDVVRKTWPGFWTDMARAGFVVEEGRG